MYVQGGLREALFSENYHILWNGRTGFAKIAKEANVVIFYFRFHFKHINFILQYIKPIIPVFTENCQQLTFMPVPAFKSIISFFIDKNILISKLKKLFYLTQEFFRWIYEKTHIGFIPSFGWLPVKLR